MKVYSLVHIGRDTFIMLNAKDDLKNSQCNSTIFENKVDANLGINVFEYYGLKVNILIDNLDRRTKRFKQFEKDYQYFSVSFLPKIKERSLSNRITGNYKF
jgi:hypothetical protein